MQSPEIRGTTPTQITSKPASAEALLVMLGQLKANSPSSAITAKVVQSRPSAEGQHHVTLEIQGQRFTLTASNPPTSSPLQLYRQAGMVRVAAGSGGQSRAGAPISTHQQLLSALPQLPSPAARIIQSAMTLPGFSAWAGVFAQITQPDALKRWVQANSQDDLLKSMAQDLPDALKERFAQVNDQRTVQSAEDQRQGIQSFQFDVPLPIGERWVNGEATLKRHAKQRDQWSFELVFDLPSAGRLIARADIAPARVMMELLASRAEVHQKLVALAPNLEMRLRAAGVALEGIRVTPMKTHHESAPTGRLDVRV